MTPNQQSIVGDLDTAPDGARRATSRRRTTGQAVVLLAGAIFMLAGMIAVVIDVSWYWANTLRIQRAADAAALAGVVWLPGDATNGFAVARAEATKNGYANGTAGVVVTPSQDGSNPRRLNVTINAPVGTFFMRVFGLNSIPATRTARAEFVLPVPMGSPQNYYGVFGLVRTPGGGTTTSTTVNGSTGKLPASAVKFTNANWNTHGNVYTSDDQTAWTTNTSTSGRQGWGNFGFTFPGGASIDGIEVFVEARSADAAGCRLQVDLSWNNGTSWTAAQNQPLTGTDPASPYIAFGGGSDTWGRSWTTGQFSNANFQVRLRNLDGATACTNNSRLDVDYIEVRIQHSVTTSVFVPDSNLTSPTGGALAPQGFWGTFINQGADKVNGDAYLPKWNPRTSSINPEYDPSQYYNYDVIIPSGAANGEVWIYDPVFCAVAANMGTGDRWFSGNNPTSAYYTLYDTNNTPFDLTDDTQIATSGSLFENIQASDQTLNGPSGVASCAAGATSNPSDGRYWHNRWWQLGPSTLAGGRTYRVHTRSTNPSSPNAMDNANGHNSFAIWSTASGGTPQVHGEGAMEAFTPLPGGGASTFYLAQIDAVHAGKTMEIRLWDPGDTNGLDANVQILQPGSGGYSAATLSYTASMEASGGTSSCNSNTGTNVTQIVTYSSGSRFNGCWLTIVIPLPATYSAPTPPGETEPGWWKIRYNMSGSSSTSSFDLTTWQVSIRGNPVHLIVP